MHIFRPKKFPKRYSTMIPRNLDLTLVHSLFLILFYVKGILIKTRLTSYKRSGTFIFQMETLLS